MSGPNGGPGEDLGPLLRRHPAGRPSAVSRLPSPKHHRQRVGPAAVSRLGIAGPDAVFQSLRGNQAVHALQEDLPAGPALLVLVFQVGKEPALVKTGAGSSWNCPTASRPMTPPAFAGQALSEIMARYQGEDRGGPPYHPRMMVKMLPYAYSTVVASSRRSRSAITRTSPSGRWRPTTLRTSGPSPTSARTTWRRWGICSSRPATARR